MKKLLFFLLLCSLNCHSQSTYVSNVTTHANGLNEKMRRELIISNDTIEIKSFGKLATHSQFWEVLEVDILISDKFHEVKYKCISLNKEFPTIIMLLFKGDNSKPSQIVAIQPTPVNLPDEETIFWIE